MLLYRKNPLSSDEELIHNISTENKSLQEIFSIVMELKEIPVDAHKAYAVILNGELRKDLDLVVKEDDVVLIACMAKGDNLKTAAALVVAVVITWATGGTAYAAYAPYLAAAGMVGTSLLLNKLFPPIIPTLAASSMDSIETSQTYSIAGQSNGVKQFGQVPKVYGKHRIFPNIVGAPFISLEMDSDGKVSQYMTAIYDLGFGPMYIEDRLNDIKIGDTPIGSFTDYELNLVDLNRPTVDEGVWDEGVDNYFSLYSGDVNSEDGGFVFQGTLAEGGDSDFWSVIRTFPSNSDLIDQEYSVFVAFQKGLYSVSTDGSFGTGRALITMQISKVEENNWKDITDESIVKYYNVIAGRKPTYTLSPYFSNRTHVRTSMTKNAAYPKYNLEALGAGIRDYGEEVKTYAYISNYLDIPFSGNPDVYLVSIGDEVQYQGGSYGKVTSITDTSTGRIIYFENAINQTVQITSIWMGVNADGFGVQAQLRDIYVRYTYVTLIKNQVQLDFTSSKQEALYGQITLWPVVPGNYKFKLIYNSVSFQHSYTRQSELSLLSYSQRLFRLPIITDKRHLFLELKIKASNQLNGTIQNLSVVGTSVLDYYDTSTSTWKKKPTSNPAWVYADILTGQINKKRLDKSRIDTTSISQWASFCEEVPTPLQGDLLNTGLVTSVTLIEDSYNFENHIVDSTSVRIVSLVDNTTFYTVTINTPLTYVPTYKYACTFRTPTTTTTKLITPIDSVTFTIEKPFTSLVDDFIDVGRIEVTYKVEIAGFDFEGSGSPEIAYSLNSSTLKPALTYNNSSLEIAESIPVIIGDTISIYESYNYTLPRYECNFVFDYNSTVLNLITSITNSYQAAYSIIDGKYGVLIDKRKTTPVQIFTPRNSWGFSFNRQYDELPQAYKVKYIDKNADWEQREEIIYREGYTIDNAEVFEDVTSFAVTNNEQAFRFGRYLLAQGILRKEVFTLNVDFEHLVCTRGDLVYIANDILKSGGVPSRVKSVVDNGTSYSVEIDENIIYGMLKTYGVTCRSATIATKAITPLSESSFEVAKPFSIAEGNLVIIGETNKIVYECIVKSISPNEDLSATITLIERADAIHDADSILDIPDYNPLLTTNQSETITPPAIVDLRVVDNYYECTGSGYNYFIDLAWSIPAGAFYNSYEIYYNTGNGYALVGYSNTTEYKFEVSLIGQEHFFKVLGLNSLGSKIELASAMEISVTPLSKTARPSSIGALDINVTNEVLQLSWVKIEDCDCDEYLIRYSPLIDGLWEVSIPLLRVDSNTSMASFQARTGTYLIKAVDFNGNESLTAAKAITSIPELFNLHSIAQITDSPTWLGQRNKVVLDVNAVMLQEKVSGTPSQVEYYPEGYYYYRNLIDLGDIYTVRLESSILAEGYTPGDTMSNWTTLSGLLAMSGSRYSDWDVELQVRSTDRFDVIANWTNLSSVAAMSEGGSERFTEWRKLSSIGDFTGRIFQFRLKLISNKASVTPRVYVGDIKAHFPTRIESFENEICPIGGIRMNYATEFYGPSPSPAIQISQDSAVTGDTYLITDKDLAGFYIEFFDGSSTSVSRQFDATIKGYGHKFTEVI